MSRTKPEPPKIQAFNQEKLGNKTLERERRNPRGNLKVDCITHVNSSLKKTFFSKRKKQMLMQVKYAYDSLIIINYINLKFVKIISILRKLKS